MVEKFSKELLFELRNFIPIDELIKTLRISNQKKEGVFRFLCPFCQEFNTSVKPTTNLARCFNCSKNFNTIDLTMKITKKDFRESVKYLIAFKERFVKEGLNLKPEDNEKKGAVDIKTLISLALQKINQQGNL